MRSKVEWTGGTSMVATNEAGQPLELDWKQGPSPMQIALQAVGACSLVDVVIGMKDRPLEAAWVELDSTRAETTPRRFTGFSMTYHIRGDVPLKLAERIVAKSHEKFCSVSHSTAKDITTTWTVEVHPIIEG